VFLGNPRCPIAKSMYIDLAFVIALLRPGQTVGEASKSALNSAITLFELHNKGWDSHGITMDHYNIENHILLGDPALVPFPARETPRKKAACATFVDDVVSAPHCPDCSKAMETTDTSDHGYTYSDYTCNGCSKSVTTAETNSDTHWRWVCEDCRKDYCFVCKPQKTAVITVEGPSEWEFTKYHPSVTPEWRAISGQGGRPNTECPDTLFIPTAPGVALYMDAGVISWMRHPNDGVDPSIQGDPNRSSGFGPWNVSISCITVTIKSSEKMYECSSYSADCRPSGGGVSEMLDGSALNHYPTSWIRPVGWDYPSIDGTTSWNEEGTECTKPFLNHRDRPPPLDQYMEPDGTHVATFVLRMLDGDDKTGRVLRWFRRARFNVHNAGKIISVTTM